MNMISGRDQNRTEDEQNGRNQVTEAAEVEAPEGRDSWNGHKAAEEHKCLQSEEDAGVKTMQSVCC